MSTAEGILIHWDYGTTVFPKKPSSTILPVSPWGVHAPPHPWRSPQIMKHLPVILVHHIAQRSCGCPVAGSV